MKSPFDASSFQDADATRVSLCVEADAQLCEWLQELDVQFLKLCRINCQKLFGKQVYLESDLKPNYYSALKDNQKYGTQLFKMKMNKVGKGAVRAWNKRGAIKRNA